MAKNAIRSKKQATKNPTPENPAAETSITENPAAETPTIETPITENSATENPQPAPAANAEAPAASPEAPAANAEPSSDPAGATSSTEHTERTGPTGPRTPEGKARASMNAVKLGLSIQRHVILPDEDPEEYARLRDSILHIYQPISSREVLAIDDVAQCRWAFRRFDDAERLQLIKSSRGYTDDLKDPFTYGQMIGILAEPQKFEPGRYDPFIDQKPRPYIDRPLWPGIANIHRYRTWWERKHTRALAEFERACKARRQEERDQQRNEWHAARMEWQQLRIAAEKRRAERDTQRYQQAEAAERRREERHVLHMKKSKEGPTMTLGKILKDFVPQKQAKPQMPDFPSHRSDAPRPLRRRY